MFHWTPEGCALKSGFNFYVSIKKCWLRIVFVEVDLLSSDTTIRYFRFRPYLWPWLIFQTEKFNIIKNSKEKSEFYVLTSQNLDSIKRYVRQHRPNKGSIRWGEEIIQDILDFTDYWKSQIGAWAD